MRDEVADAVVVGSGPSGSIVTHTLADRGFNVVCLEQGDWVNPSDYPANNAQWELQVLQQWSRDPNVRGLPADYPVNVERSDMQPVMYNAVGGSSILYGAEWPRLLPSDFRSRTLHGEADDWPIKYEDLVPYYEAVDKFIGVSGLGGDPAFPEGPDFPMPPHPLGKSGIKGAQSANKLGWHWWPGTNAIASNRFKELAQCGRWGTCEWGCPEGAKASFDIAYWPHALKSGATLITGARARKVETGPDGRATAVVWIDQHGHEHRQRTNAVVLCANGIGTSRLLLLSDSPTHPDGLANSSGLVGRNLMLHPNCSSTGYYDEDMESWLGPAGQLIYSLEFYDPKPQHNNIRGIKLQLLPMPGPLSAVDTHGKLAFDAAWGPSFEDAARSHRGALLWAANTEDLPDPSNRITLDPVLKDSSGIPAPAVEYRISEHTMNQLRFAVERMEELHRAGGAKVSVPVELWVDQPGHLLGTARMGHDPRMSVVNAWGQAHDCDNLFIADGSIFVTSGSVNPTCSIAALALRLGTHVADTAHNRRSQA